MRGMPRQGNSCTPRHLYARDCSGPSRVRRVRQQLITQAARRIATQVKNGETSVDDICEQTICDTLSTASIPDPDLLIRTGGEQRISNFLLWQIAYSELYFTDILWPDFDNNAYLDALIDYQGRERRFGKTSDQVKSSI